MVPAYKSAKYPLILVSDSGIKSKDFFQISLRHFYVGFELLCLFSEGGHADWHGGRYEGGRGPGPPDALHLRQCRPPLHPGEGTGHTMSC